VGEGVSHEVALFSSVVMRLSRAASLALGLLAAACNGGRERPDPATLVRKDPPKVTEPQAPNAGSDAGIPIDVPDVTCGEFCGETFLREVKDPPNLYFVVDRSGSMGELVERTSRTKFQIARRVISEVLSKIGHRVRYGGAVFPSFEAPQECRPGTEFFEPKLGTLPACETDENEQLTDFVRRLGAFVPEGGTPIAITLEALLPRLEQLEGRTAVVLVTDGAPNCNLDAACDAAGCGLNVEGASIAGVTCNDDYNCCDPRLTGFGANGYCVDSEGSEEAVLALAAAGIETYVVGLPGAEPYSDVLSRLAEAGGQPREGTLPYFATTDEAELREALYAIGTGVAIRCAIDLETPPEDPALVNVYFDGELLPADQEDGWSWDGDLRIEVHGEACADLRSGEVLDARVVFGCDTVVR
jgi:hypothetical protein